MTFPPRPQIVLRKARSFKSTTLLQTILRTSIFRGFPWWIELSSIAAIRLLAAVIAWISPVKCKLISSIGTTCAYPPPAAPPLIPKHGPKDGSLIATTDFFPNLFKAWDNPIIVVVLPSPAGVGLIAVTKINFPSGLFSSRLIASSAILALYLPYNSKSSSSKPTGVRRK